MIRLRRLVEDLDKEDRWKKNPELTKAYAEHDRAKQLWADSKGLQSVTVARQAVYIVQSILKPTSPLRRELDVVLNSLKEAEKAVRDARATGEITDWQPLDHALFVLHKVLDKLSEQYKRRSK